jgi:Arc/MetJ-type ribon-helix-helix transcriptional regulator
MKTVSFRVPEDVKANMDAHDRINWGAVLREHVEAELADLDHRKVAHAVATSEALSGEIDEATVDETNTADVIRSFRDGRYGDGSA